MKKVLINFVTVGEEGIHLTWLIKFQHMESLGCELFFNGGTFIRKLQLKGMDVYKFNETIKEFQDMQKTSWTKLGFIRYSIWRNLISFPEIYKQRNNFDVAYSPSSVLDLVIIPYALKMFNKKIKWVAVFDNIVPFTDPGNKLIRFLAWLFFQISLFFLKRADCIFTISEDLKKYLLKKGFRENRIKVTGNAIEINLIKEAKKDERYSYDALFVGRINETKGIYDMLNVLTIIKKKHPLFQLAIMGDGDDTTKKQFQCRIKELSLEKNIQFLGYQKGLEKFNIIKSSKCFWFLSVSKSESFGIALLEAVCCGIPAFAYDLPQFSYIYPDGEVNIFPKYKYEMVAQKVVELFDKGNFRNEKGEKLLDKYSWERIANLEFDSINKL